MSSIISSDDAPIISPIIDIPYPLPPIHRCFRDMFIKDPNFSLIKALLKVIEPKYNDKFAVALVNLYTNPSRSTDPPNAVLASPQPLPMDPKFWDLVAMILDFELSKQEGKNLSKLFFHSSLLASIFSNFSRLHGLKYIESMFGPLIRKIVTLPGSWEIDASKIDDAVRKMAQAEAERLCNKYLLDTFKPSESDSPSSEIPVPSLSTEEKQVLIVNLTSTPVAQWTPAQSSLWILFGLKQPIIAKHVLEEKIIGDKLSHITSDHLNNWGISSLSSKKSFITATQAVSSTNIPSYFSASKPGSSENLYSIAKENLIKVQQEHVEQLKLWTNDFIKALLPVPAPFQHFLSIVHRYVSKRFDLANANQLISSLLFARFICPALTGPKAFNLIQNPISPSHRQCLILIAKLITKAINQSPITEDHLKPFKKFVENHSQVLQKFAHGSHSKQRLEEKSTETGPRIELYKWKHLYFNTSKLKTMQVLNSLHYFIEKYEDELFKRYLKVSCKSCRKACLWDKLVVILHHLGPTIEPQLYLDKIKEQYITQLASSTSWAM